MEELKGKTILVGKEPNNGRLKIAVDGKSTLISSMGCVPNSVSRCKPAEGIAHCSISVDMDGKMKVRNLKSQNTTKVNGLEVEEKRIDTWSSVTLGKDNYAINISTILEEAKKLLPRTFSLRPLEIVWKKYENDLLAMQVEQAKRANRQRLHGAVSFLSMGASFIPGIGNVIKIFIVISAVLYLFYTMWQGSKKENMFAIKKHEREMQFQNEYVCPNPNCRCFKGSSPYITLKNTLTCPVCKCKYTV